MVVFTGLWLVQVDLGFASVVDERNEPQLPPLIGGRACAIDVLQHLGNVGQHLTLRMPWPRITPRNASNPAFIAADS
jgi:hypothetical protein